MIVKYNISIFNYSASYRKNLLRGNNIHIAKKMPLHLMHDEVILYFTDNSTTNTIPFKFKYMYNKQIHAISLNRINRKNASLSHILNNKCKPIYFGEREEDYKMNIAKNIKETASSMVTEMVIENVTELLKNKLIDKFGFYNTYLHPSKNVIDIILEFIKDNGGDKYKNISEKKY